MSQLRRDSYHLGGDYATNEMEAREKIRETIVRLLTRIKSEVTTNVMAPLAITDPILFAQLSAEQWMDDFRESRRDHGHFRDWLLDGLKQLVDSVDELKEVALEDVPRHVGAWSKVRGTAWSVFTDLDVARGFIDVVTAVSLRARNRTLDDRQADLDKRYAYIKREIQRCIDSVRKPHSAGGAAAKQASTTPKPDPTPQRKTTPQQRTDWSALDQVILKDLPAEDKKGLEDFLNDDEEIECFKRRPDKPNQSRVFKTMDDEEFERAVKIAEADINKLTPDELLDQLANLETTGASELRDEAEQNLARKLWTERHQTALPFLAQEFKEQYPALSPEEATASLYRELGEERFNEVQSSAEALRKENPLLSQDEAIASTYRELGGPAFTKADIMHTRDIGGAGNPIKFSGLGDSSINRSIGAQWTKAKLRALKKKAERAKREGKNKMDVQLKVCQEEAK